MQYLDLSCSSVRFDFLTREQLNERGIIQFASPLHTLDVLGNAIPRFNEEARSQLPPSFQRRNSSLEERHLEEMLNDNRYLHGVLHLNGDDGAKLTRRIDNLMATNRDNYFRETNDIDPFYN